MPTTTRLKLETLSINSEGNCSKYIWQTTDHRGHAGCMFKEKQIIIWNKWSFTELSLGTKATPPTSLISCALSISTERTAHLPVTMSLHRSPNPLFKTYPPPSLTGTGGFSPPKLQEETTPTHESPLPVPTSYRTPATRRPSLSPPTNPLPPLPLTPRPHTAGVGFVKHQKSNDYFMCRLSKNIIDRSLTHVSVHSSEEDYLPASCKRAKNKKQPCVVSAASFWHPDIKEFTWRERHCLWCRAVCVSWFGPSAGPGTTHAPRPISWGSGCWHKLFEQRRPGAERGNRYVR